MLRKITQGHVTRNSKNIIYRAWISLSVWKSNSWQPVHVLSLCSQKFHPLLKRPACISSTGLPPRHNKREASKTSTVCPYCLWNPFCIPWSLPVWKYQKNCVTNEQVSSAIWSQLGRHFRPAHMPSIEWGVQSMFLERTSMLKVQIWEPSSTLPCVRRCNAVTTKADGGYRKT